MSNTPNTTVDDTPKKRTASTHTRHPKSKSSLSRHPKSKTKSTPSLRTPPPALPLPQSSSSFCQAIVFFYSCGCRSSEPVYACQPPNGTGSQENPCKHETPEMIVAKLPHACKKGTGAACGAEDPGAKEFVREVDTAERLDLAVLDSLEKKVIDTALPGKVEGEFTVDQVVSRSKSVSKKKSRSAFSATATPFVPQGTPPVPSNTPPLGEKNPEVPSIDHHVVIESIEKGADGADTAKPSIVEADKATVATEDTCTKEEHANMGDERNKHQRNVSAEEEFEEVALDDKPADDDNDHDLELPELSTKYVVDSEQVQSNPSTPWPKVGNEKPTASTAEPKKLENPEPQYDNLLKMLTAEPEKLENSEPEYDNLLKTLATEKREEEKKRRKAHRSCWSGLGLFQAWLYGTRA